MITEDLSNKVVASATVFYGALIVASLLLLLVVRRCTVNLVLGASAAVTMLVGVVVSQALVSGLPASAGTARTGGLVCRQGRVEVCVWKEHSDRLPGLATMADGFAAKLAARGVDTVDRLTESDRIRTPRTGLFMVSDAMSDAELRVSLAQGFTPSISNVQGCENKVFGSSQTKAVERFLVDVSVAQNWVTQVLHVPSDNPLTNRQALASAKTLQARSRTAQARWFLAVSSAVATCDLSAAPSAKLAG